MKTTFVILSALSAASAFAAPATDFTPCDVAAQNGAETQYQIDNEQTAVTHRIARLHDLGQGRYAYKVWLGNTQGTGLAKYWANVQLTSDGACVAQAAGDLD